MHPENQSTRTPGSLCFLELGLAQSYTVVIKGEKVMSRPRIVTHILMILLLVLITACKPTGGPGRTSGGTGTDQNAGGSGGQSTSGQASGGQMDAIAQEVKLGNDVFVKNGCLGCHKVGDEGGSIGPELTLIGQRMTMDQMSALIRNPQAVKPDARMPAQSSISDQDMAYLVRYLSTLK
jgi:cytochrome c2